MTDGTRGFDVDNDAKLDVNQVIIGIGKEGRADLPIERAVKFELIVNLKTAKTLGATVPLTLIVSAEGVPVCCICSRPKAS